MNLACKAEARDTECECKEKRNCGRCNREVGFEKVCGCVRLMKWKV